MREAKIAIEGEDGALVAERVDFDSEIFGIEVARVTECRARKPEALASLHAQGVARLRAAGFVHVSRRVAADDRAEIAALEDNRYCLSDVAVIFEHDLRGVAPGVPEGFRAAEEQDIERVVAECGGIFRTSRYYHDPAFGEAGGDEAHRRWIVNSFRGRADVVLVSDDASAFVTCAVDQAGVGNIALFGVAPRAQGKGLAPRLLSAALGWFKERASRVDVKTQATNYPAARTYERGGFRLKKSELTYAYAASSESRS